MIGHLNHVASRAMTALFAIALLAGNCFSISSALADTAATQPAGDKTNIEVEKAPQVVRRNGPLGTTSYRQTDEEKRFMEKTAKSEQTIGTIGEDTPYDLASHKGKYVSWFGIVRSITKRDDGFDLQLEHKYFDGLTDLHILALSFNGAGDFKARVKTGAADIHMLELVRVYGIAGKDAGNAPTIDAEYVRVFPWRTFTFLDCYGKDQTNPAWRKLCKVPLDDIYSSVPDNKYYRDRLGERSEKSEPPPAQPTK